MVNGMKMNDNNYIMDVKPNTTITCDRIVVHNNPIRYGFNGWSTNPVDTQGQREITVNEEDMIVYAIFKEKEYAINIVNKSTSNDEIYLEVTTQSADIGIHFEWLNCNGEQNMNDGQVYVRLWNLNNDSILNLHLNDEIFYKITGSNIATLYSFNTWHIDEINEKLGNYNISFN